MAEEERYSNRQIERMLEMQSADLKAHIDAATIPILAQTTKTNGRVTKNEDEIVAIKIWRGWMTGGMAIIMVILPIVVSLLAWIILSVIQFDKQLNLLTELMNK